MNLIKEFFVIVRSNNKNISGECKLCGKNYSDTVGSTGNFHKHLKRKHLNQYEQVKFPDAVIPQNDMNDYQENFNENITKINLSILTELIIRCNLPPTMVEQVGFRNFLKTVAPKWKPTSSRYFTRTLLPSMMTDSQNKIKKILDDINHLSITVDVWTDRRGRSFIGITGHFLDTNYVPRTLLLDFSRLKGSHTGENIRHITEEILDNLKIRHKVFRIVTDNAASMIKAYKFGLIVNDSDYDIPQSNKRDKEDSLDEIRDDNDFNMVSGWSLIDWCESEGFFANKNEYITTRLPCFAHSLQLAIRDGLKGAPYLSNSLSKCIQLARRSYKSTKIADLLDNIGKMINRSNMTRWSSEYLLIKSIIELEKKTIDEITDIIDDDDLKFNNNDFVVLQEAIEILEPFAEITARIQSESAVTISLVVPSVVHIIEHMKNIKSNLSFLIKTCEQIEQSINKRFAGISKRLFQQSVCKNDPFSDQIYFVCTVLDPEFKFYWLRQMNYKPQVESQMKQLLIQMVLNECEKNIDASLTDTEHEPSSSFSTFSSNNLITQSLNGPIAKKRKLFHYENDSVLSFESTSSPLDEINAYINDQARFRFSTYWKSSQFHFLKNVVKRIFSVQASSAPIERVFSQAGLIMSPRRTSMLEEVFRNLVFLRINQHLI